MTRGSSSFSAKPRDWGLAVFVHAMPVASDRLPGPAAATFGIGMEGSLAAAAIITGGVAEKYPSLRLAFSHAAGGLPLQLPRAQWSGITPPKLFSLGEHHVG